MCERTEHYEVELTGGGEDLGGVRGGENHDQLHHIKKYKSHLLGRKKLFSGVSTSFASRSGNVVFGSHCSCGHELFSGTAALISQKNDPRSSLACLSISPEA